MKSKLIAIAVLLLSIPMFGYVAQTNLDINGNVVSEVDPEIRTAL